MTIRLARRSCVSVCALAVGLLAAPQTVLADGVDDAQRQLNRVLDELEQLRDEMGQIDEDYNGALDRQDELVVEIAASQARVDEMTTVLGDLQLVLQQIAIKRFTSSDSSALSPIFSSAATYGEAGQRSALAALALDSGEGNVDDVQSVVDDLAAERATLARKQQEATQLIAVLDAKKLEMVDLEEDYLARYATAERNLGKAKLQAAEAAREAAAAAAAREAAATAREQKARAAQPKAAAAAPRGAGATPPYTGAVPAVSGSAGIAVSAAYSQIGVPYIAFAASPGSGFDCSGLTQFAWGQAGVRLPHQSGRQFATTANVPQDQVQPGDLIFYYTPISHVGIYVGGGQMIHAPAPGKSVGLTTVNWSKVVGVSRPG
jgi:cell wall-associated NlpC family hydrolase